MRLGVMYPGDELTIDADGLDRWIATVEGCGFDHVVFGDHVLGVEPTEMQPGWDEGWPSGAPSPAYTYRDVFREPLTLFGYLAARSGLELVTGVLVLPQRQTALVAKQAAEVDLLSRGRLRLSVGIGWNRCEYEGLGTDFASRGRRMDEQIEVLRRFWTEEIVTFSGEFHHVVGSGIMSLPVQRPIPIWVGATSPAGFRRVGRLGDGCFLPPGLRPDDGSLDRPRAAIRETAEAAGRDPATISLEGRVLVGAGEGGASRAKRSVEAWRQAEVAHVCLDTRHAGRRNLADHLEAIEVVGAALAGLG